MSLFDYDVLTLFGIVFFKYMSATALHYLLAEERGPFAIFSNIRDWAGVYYDINGDYSGASGELGKMIMCRHCSTLVYSLILVILMLVSPTAWVLLCLVLSTYLLARG